MPKCKNCYHNKVCFFMNCCELENCRYFKDKSLIAELLCKVGDILYQIDGGEIYPIKISDIAISDSGTEFNGCEIDDEGNEFDEYSIQLSEFGETVFKTREEAEKALEEMKNE